MTEPRTGARHSGTFSSTFTPKGCTPARFGGTGARTILRIWFKVRGGDQCTTGPASRRSPLYYPGNCSRIGGLLHRVDHVEDRKVHGHDHATDDDAEEHDHERLEEAEEA